MLTSERCSVAAGAKPGLRGHRQDYRPLEVSATRQWRRELFSDECKPTAKVATLVPEPDSVFPFKGTIIRMESTADTGTQELREVNGESTCLAPGPGQ